MIWLMSLSLAAPGPYVPMVTMCVHISFLSVTERGGTHPHFKVLVCLIFLGILLQYLWMTGVWEKFVCFPLLSHSHSTSDTRCVCIFFLIDLMTPSGCPIIWLSFNTIYLKLVQTPQVKGSLAPDCTQLQVPASGPGWHLCL